LRFRLTSASNSSLRETSAIASFVCAAIIVDRLLPAILAGRFGGTLAPCHDHDLTKDPFFSPVRRQPEWALWP